MITFDRIALESALTPAELWHHAAQAARDWMQAREVLVRDAIVLVPFAQLLAPARRAFAALGGWMPRVETTHTLSAALAPQPAAADAGPSGDPGIDRLRATALLRNQAWAREWERRDRRGFAHGVSSMVDAAQLLQRAAAGVQPAARAAWWADARLACDLPGWPGDAIERALLQTAVAWASVSTAPASDVLFALRPSALVMVEAGGADPVAASVLAHAAAHGIAAASLVADSMTEDPFAVDWPAQSTQRRLCPDGEVEAWAAASLVIDAVNSGATPVALIAEDRLLARRVRALLERVGLAVDDETGWTLSTTRAAAHLMGLLRAASAHAGTDQLLDWLIDDCDTGARDAVIALEAAWRAPRAPESSAADLWARQRKRLDRLAEPPRRPLHAWLETLNDLMQTGMGSQRWRDDPAWHQVRAVLRLDADAQGGRWDETASVSMDLDEFTAWVDATLDRSQFVPPADDAPVTITPLARALLRPFASVIVPGADELRLGPGTPVAALLGDSALRRLGLPDRQERWRRRARCFVALLRSPNVTLLRRAVEGDEPLAPSPLALQAELARRTAGRSTDPERPVELAMGELPLAPVCAPMPSIANRLPESLSASAVNALRECPYRFFTQAVLRLREREEFDAEPGQREYGNWLHATLQHFHDTRASPLSPALEADRLQQVAERTVDALGLDRAALLPFRAGLAGFARRYIAWLHQRDGQGWHYRAGEQALEALPPPLRGTGLHGRIDRIDDGPDKAVQLIDYKTSNPVRLKQRLREPLEDAQLAFYAALISDRLAVDQTLSAGYLALDDRAAVELFSPTQVQADAQQLIQGLSQDLQRMRAGAPLLALGAPPVCDWCEVRGLCRRDHWAPNERGSAERS